MSPEFVKACDTPPNPSSPTKAGYFQIVNSCLKDVHLQQARAPDYSAHKAVYSKAPHCIPNLAFPNPAANILELIGNTPLVRIDKWARANNLRCNVLAKLEFFSPGGSVKDRMAKFMVDQAEQEGRIRPGDIIIEGTSGNTGIGLCMIAAARGYHVVICMPEKMSMEKENIMKALGAQVIRTRTSASFSDDDSHITIAYRLADAINSRPSGPKAVCLDQYLNAANPRAHYATTAEEIFRQTAGKLDAAVFAPGTGGTLTGTGQGLKDRIPGITIVGVDPDGSIMHKSTWCPEDVHPYEVEGIGYDFHPGTFHKDVADEWIVATDVEAFKQARMLISLEGILVGGSSGTALVGAFKYGQTLREDQTLVVLLPDSIRNYISKFVSDDWMTVRGFMRPLEHRDYPIISSVKPSRELTGQSVTANNSNFAVCNADAKIKDTVMAFLSGTSQRLLIEDANGTLLGTLARRDLEKLALSGPMDERKKFQDVTLPLNVYMIEGQVDTAEVTICFRAIETEGRTGDPCLFVLPKDALVTPSELIEARKNGLKNWRSYRGLQIVDRSDMVKSVFSAEANVA